MLPSWFRTFALHSEIGQADGVAVVRNWWPVPVIIAVALAIQTLVLRDYEAHGHASGHLQSAQVVFFGGACVATLLWSTPRARKQPDVLIACAAWFAALVGVAIGNLRVVDAIGGANWADDQADTLGTGLPGFESGHDLAGTCAYLAMAAAILLTILLRARRHIGTGVSIGAIAATIVFPYWIVPGAGVVVVTIALCVARQRRLTVARI